MDLNNPTLASTYTGVLSDLATKDTAALKWFEGESHTNIVVGTKRQNPTTKEVERWDGAQWVEWDTRLKDHLVNVSNPHGTTAAQVGAASSSDFNSHVANVSNPHATTAAQVGAPTLAAFNAHFNDTVKHPTSAGAIGGLLTANNLSELAPTAATARTSIGAASDATLSAHTANVSNPHNVTRAQLGAAASGSNSDISMLNSCSFVGYTGGGLVVQSASYTGIYTANGTKGISVDSGGAVLSFGATPMRIGSTSAPFGDIFSTKFKFKGATQTWSFFAYTDISSLDPSAAGASYSQAIMVATMNAVNSIAKRLENIGLFN